MIEAARSKQAGVRAATSRALPPPPRAGALERATKWVNLAWAVSFLLYFASVLVLSSLGLLTLSLWSEPPLLLLPTLYATGFAVLAQLAMNGLDVLVRWWAGEVRGGSIACVLAGPLTVGISSFCYWVIVGRRPHAEQA